MNYGLDVAGVADDELLVRMGQPTNTRKHASTSISRAEIPDRSRFLLRTASPGPEVRVWSQIGVAETGEVEINMCKRCIVEESFFIY